MPNWLLPENIADVLPSEARKIEELRRLMLDNFRLYGYELVMPPLLEYVESLLTGAGKDTDLRTFKLVDQMSGRMLGLRADMTTQVARIDAHLLNRDSVTRLCYAGSVLHTRPSGLHATREPLQIGAEIYGHAGLEADAEIQELALASLALAGFPEVRLDLSHVGVLRAIIARRRGRQQGRSGAVTRCCAPRTCPGLDELTAQLRRRPPAPRCWRCRTCTATSTCWRARATCCRRCRASPRALAELAALAGCAIGRAEVAIDLADLRGYQYESGAMFALYVPGPAECGGARRPLRPCGRSVRPGPSRDRLLARPARTGAAAADRRAQAFDPRAVGQCARAARTNRSNCARQAKS